MADITCKAKNCAHHTESDGCNAQCICINCECANCSAETECKTFVQK